jgi:protein-disulfide isomerase
MASDGPRRLRRRTRREGGVSSTSPTGGGTPSGGGGGSRGGWRATIDSLGGFLTIGSIGGAVLVVLVLIVVSRSGSDSGGGSDAPYVPIARGAVDGRVEGDPDARVRILEFSDFQCPFCQRFHDEISPLLRAEFIESGQASLEYAPVLVLGADSQSANEAALCAADQGRFWEMHDLLFQRQSPFHNDGTFSRDHLKSYARDIETAVGGLDVARFDECVDSEEKRAEARELDAQARADNVLKTPSVLIGGQRLVGLHDIEVYREAIRDAQPTSSRR